MDTWRREVDTGQPPKWPSRSDLNALLTYGFPFVSGGQVGATTPLRLSCGLYRIRPRRKNSHTRRNRTIHPPSTFRTERTESTMSNQTEPELAESLEAMAEARQRLSEVPAEVVVTNHAMGLYELGAIHLTASPPDLVEAALAIDALACLVEGLDSRLGENFEVLKDALANIRMAFVQVKDTL